MITKFTKSMEYINSLINQVNVDTKEYKLLCALKYMYIQDYKEKGL